MAYIMARTKQEAIKKTKNQIKNVMKVSPNRYHIKVIGKPNPRLTIGKSKMYYVSIQRKK